MGCAASISSLRRRTCAPRTCYALPCRGAWSTASSPAWRPRMSTSLLASAACASRPTSTMTKPTSSASLPPCGVHCRRDRLHACAVEAMSRAVDGPGTCGWMLLTASAAEFAQHRDVGAIVVGGVTPTALVVVRHAAFGEGLHLFERAGSLRLLQSKQADQLVAASVVHFVELVAGAEFATDRIPQELHDLDALLVVDAVGATHVTLQILVDVGILKIAHAAWQIDQSRGDYLLDDGAHGGVGFRREDAVGHGGAHVGQHGAAHPWIRIVGHGIGQGPEEIAPADHLADLCLYAAKGLHP